MKEPLIIQAYRRILRNAERNKGVRLSPAEVREIALQDDAISQTVAAYDEEEGAEYPKSGS